MFTDFRKLPSALNEIMSILSGTDFDDLVDEMVEAVDLLVVDMMSENWSQLLFSIFDLL